LSSPAKTLAGRVFVEKAIPLRSHVSEESLEEIRSGLDLTVVDFHDR
jgi:hypothetical protein